jgi:thymidylate kinase
MLTEPHPYPGKLIVVEGIDGSGKSTAYLSRGERARVAPAAAQLTEP